MQIQKLEEYCKAMFLDVEFDEDIISYSIEDVDYNYKVVTDTERSLFNDDFEFIQGPDYNEDVDGYIYEFGGRWYTQDSKEEGTQLKEFKYIGKAATKIPTNSFLGIRSGYELMNGMGLYKDYVTKAKFLGVTALGICERKALSGVLLFQNECTSKGIKPITGLTIPVQGVETYDLKLYVKNFQGWLNLLKFNERLNVLGEHSIKEEDLLAGSENLFVIMDPKSASFDLISEKMLERIDFYQLDLPNYLNEEKDKMFINNIEKYLMSSLSPINIQDSFYLEKSEWKTREILWAIGKAFDYKTNNSHFKTRDEFAKELIQMFPGEDKSWVKIFQTAETNTEMLVDACNYVYDTDTRHLPKYKMTDEEKEKYTDNDELFLALIKKGFKDRGITDTKKYLERLRVEIEVLKAGDVIDYFLSLYDIVQYAKGEGLLTGLGRGSAGGSLVAYLLDIIQIDPMEFDLLFERFLNLGRMGKWEDRPFFTFEMDNGESVELAEGALVRVSREEKEIVIYCHEVIEGDEIIRY